MSILKRIGTHQTIIVFSIHIHYVSLKLSKPTPVKVSWKRRNKIAETSTIEIYDSPTDFSQTLTMLNTIYQKSSGFLPKEAEIKVLGDNLGTWKELGRLVLNLSDYIDKASKEQIYHLKKSLDKDAVICLSISTDLVKQKELNHDEYDIDQLVKQLNDAKNKLSSLNNDFEEVLSQKEAIKSELITTQQELHALKTLESVCENSALIAENNILKSLIENLKQELDFIKETNENLEKGMKIQEEILDQNANKKACKENNKTKKSCQENIDEDEIEDQASKLGNRLNDIIKKYKAIPN
ncbi:hypothetical protein SteCoe_36694 [Stentor coeruleus]|uniref:C2 NT-type domain-containing protein n=1 Tax=Stentor coeruleus TaxID=5963 RepID=A0A1R2APN2_9CILI|nr:hypothetical protein SteCoe_36694 [Stentor coeruleus]